MSIQFSHKYEKSVCTFKYKSIEKEKTMQPSIEGRGLPEIFGWRQNWIENSNGTPRANNHKVAKRLLEVHIFAMFGFPHAIIIDEGT